MRGTRKKAHTLYGGSGARLMKDYLEPAGNLLTRRDLADQVRDYRRDTKITVLKPGKSWLERTTPNPIFWWWGS